MHNRFFSNEFLPKVGSGGIMKLCALIALLSFAFSTQVFAADEFGVGAVIGSPTGISAHARVDDHHLLQGALAYSFSRYPGLHISADYVWDNVYEFDIKTTNWDVYYGLGGRVIAVQGGNDKGSTALGVRGPIGAIHTLRDPHILVFGEIAPVLNLAPNSDVEFDLGIGCRIIF
jgi:hypothetical protein